MAYNACIEELRKLINEGVGNVDSEEMGKNIEMQLDDLNQKNEDLDIVFELTRVKQNSYLELLSLLDENGIIFPVSDKITKKIDKIVKELGVLMNHFDREEKTVQDTVTTKFWLKLQGIGMN